MKTSFDKFMASTAVQEVSNVELGAVKVELASIESLKSMTSLIEKALSLAVKLSSDGVEQSKGINKITTDVRSILLDVDKRSALALDEYNSIRKAVKELGINMPPEIDKLYTEMFTNREGQTGKIVTNMNNIKDVINNKLR
jgi:hypothetical protein